MGGTSYEVCLIAAARRGSGASGTGSTATWSGLPMVEMHSIGAGGGSIARVAGGRAAGRAREREGRSRARSATAAAARSPTVTDANLRARLHQPRGALRRRVQARRTQGVREAILEQIGAAARPRRGRGGARHLPDREREHGERDPPRLLRGGLRSARLPLVVYGGNGPVHAGMQADELGIRELLVPKTSPAFSALGLLLTDYVVDTLRSYITPVGPRADASRVNELLRRDGGGTPSASCARRGSRARDLVFHRFAEPLLSGPDLRHGGARGVARGRPHGRGGARAHGRGASTTCTRSCTPTPCATRSR